MSTAPAKGRPAAKEDIDLIEKSMRFSIGLFYSAYDDPDSDWYVGPMPSHMDLLAASLVEVGWRCHQGQPVDHRTGDVMDFAEGTKQMAREIAAFYALHADPEHENHIGTKPDHMDHLASWLMGESWAKSLT